MPWVESRVDARAQFFAAYASGKWSVVDLARRHGISRKTAYKLIGRVCEEGPEGLLDRSRARRTQDHRTPEEIERRIVREAHRYEKWGPRKILGLLKEEHPSVAWPAKSTVADILQRHGLVRHRVRRRARYETAPTPLLPATEPNDLWCTDFKGWCLSRSRERLEPLTLGDGFSRYALACEMVGSTETERVWPVFARAFREYGLPRRIRSDNGPPFASPGIASLSRLSIRWLRLGIHPERIEPGKPQQNGMLERFHLTLQFEAMDPPARTRAEQARALEKFRRRFNEIRPHEALNDRAPAKVYVSSPRRFSGKLPEFEYPSHFMVRYVLRKGYVKWRDRLLYLGEPLAGEHVGFLQKDSRTWSVRLGPLEIAVINDETQDLLPHTRLMWADDAGPNRA